MDATNYLRFLQEAYQESPNTIQEDREFRDKRIEYLAKALNYPELIKLTSEFQDSTDDDYIRDAIYAPLIDSLPQLVRKKVSSVPIGTLPILEVNAHAIKVPNADGKIIIIDRGLMMTLSTFSEAQLISAFLINTQKIENKNEFIFSAYKNILDHYSGKNTLHPLAVPAMTFDIYGHGALLTIGMESFVCAHELAHIYYGHLHNDKTVHVTLSPKQDSHIEFYQKSKFQEYQADKLAWIWHQKYIRKEFLEAGENSKSSWLAAPFYLFVLFALLEKNLGISEKYSTHPSAELRMENLIKHTYAATKKSLEFKPFGFPDTFLGLIETVPIFTSFRHK
jgi:hypothetical protein